MKVNMIKEELTQKKEVQTANVGLSLVSVRYTVANWIEYLQKDGRVCFSLAQVVEKFPLYNRIVLKNALTRLTSKNKICSVWKGFYVIIPIEYQLKGIIPEVFYIDWLMKFLGRDYYISLLNAAVFYGAAHQQPQEFSVITTPPSLRSTQKKGTKINFNNRATIFEQFTEQRKTPTGYIRISSPELTATDLIQFEKEIGGINRAAMVLNELVESCDFKKLTKDFFQYVPTSIIQRLGYLLDEVLEFQSQAADLYSCVKKYEIPFRKIPLKSRKIFSNCETNKKWEVVINEQIEIDE
jgi:predicted transcriptional regulator of viral defense system